jgi:hypothetical protein
VQQLEVHQYYLKRQELPLGFYQLVRIPCPSLPNHPSLSYQCLQFLSLLLPPPLPLLLLLMCLRDWWHWEQQEQQGLGALTSLKQLQH